MDTLISQLSHGTGLTFRIDDDTCEPAASGAALNYWITSIKGGYWLVASSIYDEVYSGDIYSLETLIDKINELENDLRYV